MLFLLSLYYCIQQSSLSAACTHMAGVVNKLLMVIARCIAGKTMLLREIASVMASKLKQRVVVVDTHNEIGGDSCVPHQALTDACWLPVGTGLTQRQALLEAQHNHKPQVHQYHEQRCQNV